MIINSPNVKNIQDCQRMFDNLKFELEKTTDIDYGLWSFKGVVSGTSLNTGDKIPNDYVIDSGSKTLTTSETNSTFLLKANKLYELSADILTEMATTNAILRLQWYNELTKEYFGAVSYKKINRGMTPEAIAFIKTTQIQEVSLRVASVVPTITQIVGNSGESSYLKIKEVR
jgi:hypothetical protein